MPSTVASVLAAIDTLAPSSKAAVWDPVGLQVGDAAAPVASVAVCHDVTEAVVDVVEVEPVDLLVTYHPLLFRPVSAVTAGATPAGRALRLIRRGVAVAAVHTAFDVASGGTADALGEALELRDMVGFGPIWAGKTVKVVVFVPAPAADLVAAAMGDAGGGVIGNYSHCSFRIDGTGTFAAGPGAAPAVGQPGEFNREPEVRIEMVAPESRRDQIAEAIALTHPYEEPAFDIYESSSNAGMLARLGTLVEPRPLGEFAGDVAARLASPVRYAGDPDRSVRTIAVAPGSGSSLIEATAGRADVLVTGDVSHHRARAGLDRGLAVVDAGHVPTERPGLRALYAAVSGIIPQARDLTRFDPHPWRES